jgi:hypothetical protein
MLPYLSGPPDPWSSLVCGTGQTGHGIGPVCGTGG